MKTLIASVLTGVCCLIFGSSAHAHEFIIKPAALHAKAGDKIPFSVLSTHVFMTGEELLPAKSVNVTVLEGGKSVDVPLKENSSSQALDGIATVHAKGTAIIAGHLREPVETVASQETGSPQKVRFEKFCKVLVTVDAADKNYEKVLRHRLEIVPVGNPSATRVGDELAFKILFDGKPLQAYVYATYDGFSRYYNTYAYATESRDGIAHVKLSHPGMWMIRVEKRTPADNKDYDLLSLKATLIFAVQ
ncbi:MAG TPA: DUF4198 domain-containing protein [Methylomirabilota bacterium]|nr:DUF4198 domain-containing protein [Methylomirabilota bacterium]